MRQGNRQSNLRSGKAGFTLLEVLLAVTLGAFILTAMTTFLFGMAELWGAGANDRLFVKHARGVSRFLEQTFTLARGRYDEEGDTTPVHWMDWSGDDTQTQQYLSFELEESPGALVWPENPMPHVVCSLDFEEGEGLFLLWRSRLEEGFLDDPPRRTLISPFVTRVRYHYINYAEENPEWEIVTAPRQEADRSYVLPQRIEFRFEFNGEVVDRQLAIPAPVEGVPIF